MPHSEIRKFNLSKKVVLQELDGYSGSDDQEEADRRFIRDFVATTDQFCSRAEPVAHITASAWITTKDRQYAMLLHHKKLDIWVQPGGHVEPEDTDLTAACKRELVEETGLMNTVLSQPSIFDLDIHKIPARKMEDAHLHLDIRYWFVSDMDTHTISDESNDMGWKRKHEIHQLTREESIWRMVNKSMID